MKAVINNEDYVAKLIQTKNLFNKLSKDKKFIFELYNCDWFSRLSIEHKQAIHRHLQWLIKSFANSKIEKCKDKIVSNVEMEVQRYSLMIAQHDYHEYMFRYSLNNYDTFMTVNHIDKIIKENNYNSKHCLIMFDKEKGKIYLICFDFNRLTNIMNDDKDLYD